jgi:hypothetical protein
MPRRTAFVTKTCHDINIQLSPDGSNLKTFKMWGRDQVYPPTTCWHTINEWQTSLQRSLDSEADTTRVTVTETGDYCDSNPKS